ncbi:MAG: PQQ-binding-like beta-propeller repeat protein, partial [Polyangiales bacterium]
MTRSRSALWIGALLFAACAGRLAPAFDSRLADNDAAATAALLRSLPHDAQPRAQDALLVATTAGAQPELLLYELDHARVRWRLPLKADARPELLGDLVVTVSDQRLLAFDAKSGHLRFESATGDCTYLGAARAGTRLFYVCEQAQVDLREPPMTTLQALDVATGRKLWLRAASGGLGRPAAVGNLVLVPWQQQSLAILDAASGRELQRVRSRDDVIDWVRADESGVYFGQRTIYRLSSAGYSGTRQGARFVAVPAEELPGRPVAMESAFFAHPGSRSARGRIALYLEPEAVGEDGVRIARGRYDFVFYRYLFGFDEHGGLRYCRLLPHDAIAGQAVAAGLVLAFDTGTTALISPEDGSTLAQTEVGTELASASFDASGLRASSPATRTAPALGRCLTEIALDNDNRLVPARAYAVAQLGKLEDPTVTADLLDIYGQSSTPPELERVVADALRTRRTGLEHLIDALAQRYDFLEQTRPAPLAVIVPPLIEAHERRAVPRLVERMFDHETPIAVLPLVVRAVSELGDDGVIEPLAAFLRLYRADSTFAAQPEALLEACRGILAHGGQRGEALLHEIAGDGRAQPALARGAAALLDALHTQRAPSIARASAANELQAAPLPAKLSQPAVDATFAEHADDLRACVLAARERNPKL